MNRLRWLVVLSVFCFAGCAGFGDRAMTAMESDGTVSAGSAAGGPTAGLDAEPARWRANPLAMVDTAVAFEGAAAWLSGTLSGVKVDDVGRLVLDAKPESYPSRGTWTSPVLRAESGELTEFLPSLNLEAPADTGVRMLVRVWRGEGEPGAEDALVVEDGRWVSGWSPWLDLDGFGETRGTGRGSETRFAGGRVEVDWLSLEEQTPADAFEVRLALVSFDTRHGGLSEGSGAVGPASPAVRLFQVVVSSPLPASAWSTDASRVPRDLVGEPLDSVDLAVPYLRQAANGPALGPRTCSPTCTSMVLKYHGLSLDARLVSEAIYDRRYLLFGNWPRAAAYASTLRTPSSAEHPEGLAIRATIERFRTWDDLSATLERGVPVVASIRFEEGEFPSNRMRRTNGHLIVIRGLDGNGDAIVNDPAFADGSGEAVTLKADELARAWLGTGGVGYVISAGQ